eukprot:1649315-Amphidinium_carterae.1
MALRWSSGTARARGCQMTSAYKCQTGLASSPKAQSQSISSSSGGNENDRHDEPTLARPLEVPDPTDSKSGSEAH